MIGIQQITPEQTAMIDQQLKRTEAIINSMTRQERINYRIIDGNRRKRIARGSGASVQEVNQLLDQYREMRQMMKQLLQGGGLPALGVKRSLQRQDKKRRKDKKRRRRR
jgi:signal recognition particle subunit SRP54